MYKVAFVGASEIFTDDEERDVRQFCERTIKTFPSNVVIISGGAEGVDKIAIEIAKKLGYETQVYSPKKKKWEPPTKDGYKARNTQIANECNELFCIALPYHNMKCYHHKKPENHQKTAGCFTLNIAKTQNKPVELIVIPKR